MVQLLLLAAIVRIFRLTARLLQLAVKGHGLSHEMIVVIDTIAVLWHDPFQQQMKTIYYHSMDVSIDIELTLSASHSKLIHLRMI